MLDFALSASISEKLWNSLQVTTKLALEDDCIFQEDDQKTESNDARRRFRRVKLTGRAVMTQKKQHFGVYLNDLSPMGLGFISPKQLFPQDVVSISFAEAETLKVRLRRCRRIAEDCYICGTVFVKGPMSTANYCEILQSLKR